MRLFPGPHGVFDSRVAAVELVLFEQPQPDPSRRVPLLARRLPIRFQQLVDDRQHAVDLRLAALLLPVAGRLDVPQDLFQRLPVESVLAAGRPLAQLLTEHPAADFAP